MNYTYRCLYHRIYTVWISVLPSGIMQDRMRKLLVHVYIVCNPVTEEGIMKLVHRHAHTPS